jgi:dTMP kinase
MELKVLRELNRIAALGVEPDLTLLLDCPVEIARARAAGRLAQEAAGGGREARFENEKIEFHEKVRAGFLALAQAEPERFRVVDASRSALEVTRQIKSIIDREIDG